MLQTEAEAHQSTPSKAPKLDTAEDESDGACASKAPAPEFPVPEDEKDPETGPEEDSELLPEPENWPKDLQENLKQKFLVSMPPDFFAFWDLCLFLNQSNPREAFLQTTGLRLVGPFDLMPGSQVSLLMSIRKSLHHY